MTTKPVKTLQVGDVVTGMADHDPFTYPLTVTAVPSDPRGGFVRFAPFTEGPNAGKAAFWTTGKIDKRVAVVA